MNWQCHLVKNLLVGILPFRPALRRAKRFFRPYPVEIAKWKVQEYFRQQSILRESGYQLRPGFTVAEIGSGWHPVFGLLYYLSGASNVVLYDRQRLMDARLLTGVASHLYHNYGDIIAEKLNMGMGTLKEKLIQKERMSFPNMLKYYHMEYRAPSDFTSDKYNDEKYDLITSVDVMEHVPPEILNKMLTMCYIRLKKDGRMVHLIDHCDHWSLVDPKICRVNFLKYSDRIMNLLYRMNPLEYQNRLRHDDYVSLFHHAGFSLCKESLVVDERSLSELSGMKLDKRFSGIAHERLAIITSLIIAKAQTRNEGKRECVN